MNNITYGKCSQCGDTLTAAHVCPGGMLRSGEDSQTKLVKVSSIMKFFEYKHLPVALQAISMNICEAARDMDKILPDGPEKSAGLRKLLEAKDCFVRASL